MTATRIEINRRQYLEFENLALGAFAPLAGFMNETEFASVVGEMRLPDGEPFPLPIVLDLTREQAKAAMHNDVLALEFDGQEVGEMAPENIFTCDKTSVAQQVYGTVDNRHPGVAHLFKMGEFFVGGPVTFKQRATLEFSKYNLSPADTRAYFAKTGWRTIVGFQTRNVPHRAHEYLLRLALEQADGLFVQPVVGPKKRGDFTPLAILTAYEALIEGFLPKHRILLGVVSTTMRYAGPREAILHAIIRRNYGCTHFVVGRDHAGVGNYYGKYEAHEVTRRFDGELGIEILRFAGPFYCGICDGIVTERTCPHDSSRPEVTKQISGTELRAMLVDHGKIAPELMRPEVVASIQGLSLFIDEDVE